MKAENGFVLSSTGEAMGVTDWCIVSYRSDRYPYNTHLGQIVDN